MVILKRIGFFSAACAPWKREGSDKNLFRTELNASLPLLVATLHEIWINQVCILKYYFLNSYIFSILIYSKNAAPAHGTTKVEMPIELMNK